MTRAFVPLIALAAACAPAVTRPAVAPPPKPAPPTPPVIPRGPGIDANALRPHVNGTRTDYCPDARRERTQFRGGLRHGTWLAWHANGRLRARGHYFYGKRDGTWRWWTPSGRLDERIEYRRGHLIRAYTRTGSHKDRIMIVGDSHLFSQFGHHFHALVSQLNYTVSSHAICGCNSYTLTYPYATTCGYRVRRSWRATDSPRIVRTLHRTRGIDLTDLVAAEKPDVVILVTGTNNRPTAFKHVSRYVREVLRELLAKGSPVQRVFWIGPPRFRSANTLNAAMKRVAAAFDHAQVIDSSQFNPNHPLSRYRPHFDSHLARKWAEYVFARLRPLLGYYAQHRKTISHCEPRRSKWTLRQSLQGNQATSNRPWTPPATTTSILPLPSARLRTRSVAPRIQ